MDFSKFQSDEFSLKDFEFLNSLGHSKTSTVRKAKLLKQDFYCAIKIISKSEVNFVEKLQELVYEKETLEILDHPGIIKLIGTFTDAENVYFVLEYCENLDLGSFMQRFEVFPFELTRFYAGQLGSILSYLHTREIPHGSLNPKNILLTKDRQIKLINFRENLQPGASLYHQDNPDYVSPELLRGEASGLAADLWSFGCVIFELLSGTTPFKSSTRSLTNERIMNGVIDFPVNISPLAVDFIQSLLLQEPDMRIGVNDIEDLTSHIFLQGIIWNKVFSISPPDYSEYMKPAEEVKDQIIKGKLVKKKCGWIYKKRMLMILDTPSLQYFDPSNKSKCIRTIEISPKLKVETKGKSEFAIITPKRPYYFKDLSSNAEEWKTSISELINKFYGDH